MSVWDDLVGVVNTGVGGYFEAEKAGNSKDAFLEGWLAWKSEMGQAAQEASHKDTSTIEGVPDWALAAGGVVAVGGVLFLIYKAVK